MSATSSLLTLVTLVAVGVLSAAAFKAKWSKSHDAPGKFMQKQLLTSNELEFLARLETAAPELRFLAQVSMGALIEPAVSRKDAKAYYRLRGMFSQKIVDFAAQDKEDGSIIAIIELDDRTHHPDRDQKRDTMLASAGYRIIRWQSTKRPDAPAIRAALTKDAATSRATNSQRASKI